MNLTLLSSFEQVFEFCKHLFFIKFFGFKPSKMAPMGRFNLTAGLIMAPTGLNHGKKMLSRLGNYTVSSGPHFYPIPVHEVTSMSFSKALLMAITTFLFAATLAVTGYAQPTHANYPDGVSPELGRVVSMIQAEMADHPDAGIVGFQTAVNQAKVKGVSLTTIINSAAYNGPKNNPHPWTKKGGLEQFRQIKKVIEPIYVKAKSGEDDYLPDHLTKYSDVRHFDSRKHTDWGSYLGQIGNSCFYTENKIPGVKDTCTASYGNTKIASRKVKRDRMKTEIVSLKRAHGTKTLLSQNDTKGAKRVSIERDREVASR